MHLLLSLSDAHVSSFVLSKWVFILKMFGKTKEHRIYPLFTVSNILDIALISKNDQNKL